MAVMSRQLWLALAVVSGCSSEPARLAAPPPTTSTAQSPLTRTGIEGCNCAGAAPAMAAPDGVAYPFQSIVAYYYQVLEAFWTKIEGGDVLKTWLPSSIEAAGEEFYAWQAKSVQIYRDRDLLGFAHRYYRGTFGFLGGEPGGTGESCTPALDPGTRTTGMLAHVGLSQAGVCGENDDGTTKFWQVNHIVLLMIGDVVDAFALVDAGIARVVEDAPAELCILPATGEQGPIAAPIANAGGGPVIPCRVAFRDDAVTEGLVLPVPSSAAVAGVALGHRPFTAAGTVTMPNALDEVRTILRDAQLRVMYAIGLPRFAPEPWVGPTHVRLVGHAIGPAIQSNELLLPEERSWVDSTVGDYEERCCHVECGTTGDGALAPTRAMSATSAMRATSTMRGTITRTAIGRRAGIFDAIARDTSFPDAGVFDASLPDAVVLDAGGSDAATPDAGVFDAGGSDAAMPDAWIADAALPDAALPPPGPSDGGVVTPPGFPPGFPGPSDGGMGFPPGDAPTPGSDGGTPPGTPDGGPPDGGPVCHTVCIAEGVCTTASAWTGLVVMVSAQTTKECNGSCPEPAQNAPQTQPTCAP